MPESVQYDDSWDIEAQYESKSEEAHSTGRAVLSFQVTFVSEIAFPTKELPSSSIAPESQSEWLTRILWKVLSAAREEVFEHGMESVFSLRLSSFIEMYEEQTVRVISRLLASGSVDKEVAMETLRQLGLSEHEPTHDARQKLLLQHLDSDLAMIRYGAMYGLSYMDDERIVPSIRRAYQKETYPDLLNFMKVVLDQLDDTETGI